ARGKLANARLHAGKENPPLFGDGAVVFHLGVANQELEVLFGQPDERVANALCVRPSRDAPNGGIGDDAERDPVPGGHQVPRVGAGATRIPERAVEIEDDRVDAGGRRCHVAHPRAGFLALTTYSKSSFFDVRLRMVRTCASSKPTFAKMAA